MRLNLGCGDFPLPGYTNVDLFEPADVVGDFREMTFENVTFVNMAHVLEHIPWTQTEGVLRTIHGWMAPGGQLQITVPDMGQIMLNPPRDWVRYVYGSQHRPGEAHLAGFTIDSLRHHLGNAGFTSTELFARYSTHQMRTWMPELYSLSLA